MTRQPTRHAAGRPAAQYALRDPYGLLKRFQIGDSPTEWLRQAHWAGIKRMPLRARQMHRMFYRNQLIPAGTGYDLLQSLRRIAEARDIEYDSRWIEFDNEFVQFDSRVVGLGAHLQSGPRDPEVDYEFLIASGASTTREVVIAAATNANCVLIPYPLAELISKAAAQSLGLSAPLEIVRHRAADRNFKPIGGADNERGTPAYECLETIDLRSQVLKLFREKC